MQYAWLSCLVDANVATLIAGLGGTLLGGLIAAGAGWWQAKRQRGWQLEDFGRQVAAARDAEVRKRADEKAEAVLAELDIVESSLDRTMFSRDLWPTDQDQRTAAHQALRNVSRAALYLQEPLRQHVEVITTVLPDAEQLAAERFIEDAPRTIAWFLLRHTRTVVSQYLRGEAVSPEFPSRIKLYVKGTAALEDYIEHHIEAQEAMDEEESKSPQEII